MAEPIVNSPNSPAIDPWARLRGLTCARIGLARTGDTITGAEVRNQQAAHARTHSAIHAGLDPSCFNQPALIFPGMPVEIRSAAANRSEYVRRPDLGRMLSPTSASLLRNLSKPGDGYDLVFVAADGLSAQAVEHQAPPLLNVLPQALGPSWRIAPLVIAHNARVALGDEIGALLNARFVIMMIGERPGLSVSDSMSLYITYSPLPGRQDSERNCISNIHDDGLSVSAASHKLCWLLSAARQLGRTGIGLKDESTTITAMPGTRLDDLMT